MVVISALTAAAAAVAFDTSFSSDNALAVTASHKRGKQLILDSQQRLLSSTNYYTTRSYHQSNCKKYNSNAGVDEVNISNHSTFSNRSNHSTSSSSHRKLSNSNNNQQRLEQDIGNRHHRWQSYLTSLDTARCFH